MASRETVYLIGMLVISVLYVASTFLAALFLGVYALEVSLLVAVLLLFSAVIMVYFRIQHNIDSKYLRLCEELKRQASQSNLEQKETRNSILSLLEKLIELLHAQQKRRRK